MEKYTVLSTIKRPYYLLLIFHHLKMDFASCFKGHLERCLTISHMIYNGDPMSDRFTKPTIPEYRPPLASPIFTLFT